MNSVTDDEAKRLAEAVESVKLVEREIRERQEAQRVEEMVQGTEDAKEEMEGEGIAEDLHPEEAAETIANNTSQIRSPGNRLQQEHTVCHDALYEDLHRSANDLRLALKLREKYMIAADQSFPSVTSRFIHLKPSDIPPNSSLDVSNGYSYEVEPPFNEHPWDAPELTDLKEYQLRFSEGVVQVFRSREDFKNGKHVEYPYIPVEEFITDVVTMIRMITDGPLKSFCYRRLMYLSSKFNLHVLMSEIPELAAQKMVKHRDFYNIRKVDTHVHAASCMNQKHLLRFIKKTMKNNKEDVVSLDRQGVPMTLDAVFKSLGLTAYDLSVDTLDVHAVRMFTDSNNFISFLSFQTCLHSVRGHVPSSSCLRNLYLPKNHLFAFVNHLLNRLIRSLLFLLVPFSRTVTRSTGLINSMRSTILLERVV